MEVQDIYLFELTFKICWRFIIRELCWQFTLVVVKEAALVGSVSLRICDLYLELTGFN